MILLVNDANILIDLAKINLLESFFTLRHEFHVTDFVVGEIRDGTLEALHHYFEHGVLLKKSFSYEELTQIQLLEVEHRQLSIADCSCLFHAGALTSDLLTGDAALRKTAEQAGISVHGILWVLDELVSQKIISKKMAHESLSRLVSLNPRLPEADCRTRLNKWKKE